MDQSIHSKQSKLCGLTVREIVIFGMLGALMYASKFLMEALPNIHLLGLFIVSITLCFRWRALYPIYVYVLLDGLFAGFATWWLPYLYVWTILWGAVILLPKRMPTWLAPIVYCAVCGAHGFLFGTLYAPLQALLYGFDFKTTVAWIVAGLPYDAIHGISNIAVGILIIPMYKLLCKISKK